MGELNFPAILLAALAFFLVGALWYGVIFGKRWQVEAGVSDPPQGSAVARIMGLTLAFELLICLMLGHNIARTDPAPHVIMMMAIGFALTIMIPAIGINYLHQRRSLALFMIDAGHFLAGMAAVGTVFVAMR